MNESNVRLEIQHALQWHGYWPYHHQDARRIQCWNCHMPNVIKPDIKGRPDIEARHPTFPTQLIEVKDISLNKMSLPFSEIEPEQRAYLTEWMKAGGGAYIGIGRITTLGSTKTQISGIVVLPWSTWLKMEEDAKVRGVSSVPWDYAIYKKPPKDQSQVSIVDQAGMLFSLNYMFGGWRFGPQHPLGKPPVVEVPYFKKERRKDDISEQK